LEVLSLAAVEEACGEEDDGDHEGEPGVHDFVKAQAKEGVGEPCCKAYEPDPRRLSQHRCCSLGLTTSPLRRRGLLALFYTKY